MSTFHDNLARLSAIGYASQPLPRDLAEWACGCLRDLQQLRTYQDALPMAIGRSLRDQRILAAARLIVPTTPWDLARSLHAESQLIKSGRAHLPRDAEPTPATMRGELQAAHGWYELPDSDRTFMRLLTKPPLVCQQLEGSIVP